MSMAAAPALSGPAWAEIAKASAKARESSRRMGGTLEVEVSSRVPNAGEAASGRLRLRQRDSLRQRVAGYLRVVADEDALVGERRVAPHDLAPEHRVRRVDQLR